MKTKNEAKDLCPSGVQGGALCIFKQQKRQNAAFIV